MDLYKAIQDLYAEKEKLERVIASLEELQRAGGLPVPIKQKKRRGRKSMSAKERREVSERMKRYWESRRKPPVLSPGDKPKSGPPSDKPKA